MPLTRIRKNSTICGKEGRKEEKERIQVITLAWSYMLLTARSVAPKGGKGGGIHLSPTMPVDVGARGNPGSSFFS